MPTETEIAEAMSHPFTSMAVPDPVRGEQEGWQALFEGRKGYGVIHGEYLWTGQMDGQSRIVDRVASGAVQATGLIWGLDVFPTEEMALLAADFKNDLVIVLVAQRNDQHEARLVELGYHWPQPDCDAPFFLKGECSNCGRTFEEHAKQEKRVRA